MDKIKLPALSLEELDIVSESLTLLYMRMLRKAQKFSGERSVKMIKELSMCQALMQELTTIANYAREKKASDPDGSALLH